MYLWLAIQPFSRRSLRREPARCQVAFLSLLGAGFRATSTGARRSIFGWAARRVLDPGFAAMVRYRFSVGASRFGWVGQLLSKRIWHCNVRLAGCCLCRSSSIGRRFFLPHASAVVVGDGVAVLSNLQLYQSVAFGQRGAQYACLGSRVMFTPEPRLGLDRLGQRRRPRRNRCLVTKWSGIQCGAGVLAGYLTVVGAELPYAPARMVGQSPIVRKLSKKNSGSRSEVIWYKP